MPKRLQMTYVPQSRSPRVGCSSYSNRAIRERGLDLLRNLMTVMPDTKVIEDIHREIRVAAKQNANQKQSRIEIQNCILN